MSNFNYAQPPATGGGYAPAAPARPITLTLGYFGSLLSGVFSAIGAVLLMVMAHDYAVEIASDLLGADVVDTLGPGLVDDAVDEAAGKLVVRGVLALVSAVLVIGVALAVRNGALWARIVLTVLLLGAVCANGITVVDSAPAVVKALEGLGILLGLVSVVLLFLPATNRYAAARKQRVA